MIKNMFGVFTLLMVLASCASREKLQYYRGIEQAVKQDTLKYHPTLSQDDLLLIIISAANPEAVKAFNQVSFIITGDVNRNLTLPPETNFGQPRFQSYLIDNEGAIEFPVLGTIKLAGLTRAEAIALFKTKLTPYVTDPIITLRILNYKVTVQGEVNRPGVFNLNSERITLPEALTMAGDLSIYGKRDNILIIRETNGKKSYNTVDITKADFINSPFYYLTQNDVVYVEPNQTKINGSVIGSNMSVILTSVSLLITIVALLIR